MSLHPVDLESCLARPSAPERFLPKLLGRRPTPVILDVGACAGDDTIRYFRLFPRARLFAFEPLPANQEIIRANFSKYGVTAELVPIALSNHSGPSVFHVSSGTPPELFSGEDWNYGNKSSSLLAPAAEPMHGWIGFPDRITVTCETLDAFCKARGLGRLDFVHMDVQGAEGLVLEGAKATLSHIRVLWLEVSNQELYRGQKLRAEIEDLMRRARFKLVHEESRGVEGDQLYVNLRFPRNCAWFFLRRAESILSLLMRSVGLRRPPYA